MPLQIEGGDIRWEVRQIGVVGAGIVGIPMAALLARASVREGTREPAKVVIVQRRSRTSGWKVDAINRGESPIGGVEPDLAEILREAVAKGLLSATHSMEALKDADVVLVCVQTDRAGFGPDYGPLFEALDALAEVLRERPQGNIPLLVIESTLAPSSMLSVVRERFEARGLQDGRDILLANSPNRVMPGRLVERIETGDKLVGGLSPLAVALTMRLYQWIVKSGNLHPCNAMTAEVVKTLENAYRDVRIAYSTEVARFCSERSIAFFPLRDEVNRRLGSTDEASSDPTAVPVGDLLVPTVGVGGHCLPKDGILLWWRALEAGLEPESSLILEARRINDESPAFVVRLAERAFGDLSGLNVTILGAAYRPDSEDTRNSPSLALGKLLLSRNAKVTIHDPYVRGEDQNLLRTGLAHCFTRDLVSALYDADVLFTCVAHSSYVRRRKEVLGHSRRLRGIVDACHLFRDWDQRGSRLVIVGIGRGHILPDEALVDAVISGFHMVERGFAAEIRDICEVLNERFAKEAFHEVSFHKVRELAATCATGCRLKDPDAQIPHLKTYPGFSSRLVEKALSRSNFKRRRDQR